MSTVLGSTYFDPNFSTRSILPLDIFGWALSIPTAAPTTIRAVIKRKKMLVLDIEFIEKKGVKTLCFTPPENNN